MKDFTSTKPESHFLSLHLPPLPLSVSLFLPAGVAGKAEAAIYRPHILRDRDPCNETRSLRIVRCGRDIITMCRAVFNHTEGPVKRCLSQLHSLSEWTAGMRERGMEEGPRISCCFLHMIISEHITHSGRRRRGEKRTGLARAGESSPSPVQLGVCVFPTHTVLHTGSTVCRKAGRIIRAESCHTHTQYPLHKDNVWSACALTTCRSYTPDVTSRRQICKQWVLLSSYRQSSKSTAPAVGQLPGF